MRKVPSKSQSDNSPPEFKKGMLLVVKAPPYFTKEYFYEITSAGEKIVRANLYQSPKVKKIWKLEELIALIEFGRIRLAKEGERPQAALPDEQTTDS